MKGTRWLIAAVIFVLAADSLRAGVQIENIQAAYARFGPVRKTLTVASQDQIFFYFDVAGVQTDDRGSIDVVIRLELTDPSGKKVLEKDIPTKGKVALGGGRVPDPASVSFGGSPAAGRYTLTVTAIDTISGDKASFRRTLNCQPGGFNIVAPQFFYDAEGKIPAPLGGLAGQTLYVRLKAVGLDPGAARIEAAMTLQVLGSDGKEMMPKPIVAVFRENDPAKISRVRSVNFDASLTLTRADDFTLRVVVEDRVGKRTAAFEAPLDVTSLPLHAK
ncbi:MAG TPA: hypothetical protein VN933_16815 [Candidatus Eremiobacteraceae bacterium]|nr:hypothetical protein [Candidatus Eremiobacteraceae bacterium]